MRSRTLMIKSAGAARGSPSARKIFLVFGYCHDISMTSFSTSSKGRTRNFLVLYMAQNRHLFHEQPKVTWKMSDLASFPSPSVIQNHNRGKNSIPSYVTIQYACHDTPFYKEEEGLPNYGVQDEPLLFPL